MRTSPIQLAVPMIICSDAVDDSRTICAITGTSNALTGLRNR